MSEITNRHPSRNEVHPDFIPEGQEHLYPAIGGIFCDFIPDGQTDLDVAGDRALIPFEAVPPPVTADTE